VARIRTIKPEFWVDDRMVDLEPVVRLLFIGLWNFVDDWGLIEFKPKRIKMQVFPADNWDVSPMLQALIEAERLRVVDSDQGPLLYVVNWSRHQVVNRPSDSRFTGLPADISVNVHGALTAHPVLKGKEGKGRERKGVARKRGSRIPSDFSIDASMREWAKKETPLVNVDAKLPEFIDYWTGVAGQRGVKVDWLSTWRNGMRRLQEFAERDKVKMQKPAVDWMNR
jgi:hypothetical protein